MAENPGRKRELVDLFDEAVIRTLPVAAFALAVLYTIYSASHVAVLPEEIRTVMAGLALTSAILYAAAGFFFRRGGVPQGRGHLAAALLSVPLVANCVAHLVLTGDPAQSANFALVEVGAGLVFFSYAWLALAIGLSLGGWAAAGLILPVFPPVDTLFLLLGAAAVAFLATLARRQAYLRFVDLHRDIETSEERYRLAVDGSNDGLYDWNLDTGDVHYAPRLREMLGFGGRPGEFGNGVNALTDRIHPEDAERVKTALVSHLKSETPFFEDEFRIRHRDGSYLWVLARGASVRDEGGRALRMAGSLTDMTRRGVFDPLTGLPNRLLFMDRLARLIQRPAAEESDDSRFAVLFLDLNGFKVVNDTLGHQVGDQLLKEVSHRLQGCVRASDTVARLGGDEFVMLLERIRVPQGVRVTVDRIEWRLSQPFVLEGREFFISAAMGAVIDTTGYENAEDLVRDADTAMYRAKEQGEGCAVFDLAMRRRLTDRLRMESELRRALKRGEFVVHYQSIINLLSGEVEGYEALVRWDHPTDGLILPGDFIGLMEETGLILPLGRWVMEQAVRTLHARFGHLGADMPYVSVNLSPRHLIQDDLVLHVQDLLDEVAVEPDRLRLEITETAIIESPRQAQAVLEQLKMLGVRILMDDFGTGHSSLSYLQTLPIDTLKIDRTFIAQMSESPAGAELVHTIVRMATNLGLTVVAEGIETDEQRQLLQDMACDSGQGYLFHRPSEMEEIGQVEEPDLATAPGVSSET